MARGSLDARRMRALAEKIALRAARAALLDAPHRDDIPACPRRGQRAAALCRFAEQFEAHGAVGRLEELQEHASTEVYDKAYAILAKHYAEDGEGGEGEGAQQPGGVGASAAENAAAVVAQAGGKLFGAATPHKAAAPAPYAFAGMTFA